MINRKLHLLHFLLLVTINQKKPLIIALLSSSLHSTSSWWWMKEMYYNWHHHWIPNSHHTSYDCWNAEQGNLVTSVTLSRSSSGHRRGFFWYIHHLSSSFDTLRHLPVYFNPGFDTLLHRLFLIHSAILVIESPSSDPASCLNCEAWFFPTIPCGLTRQMVLTPQKDYCPSLMVMERSWVIMVGFKEAK